MLGPASPRTSKPALTPDSGAFVRTLPVRGLLEGAADEVRFCPGSTETERGGGAPVFSGVGPWLGEAMTKASVVRFLKRSVRLRFFLRRLGEAFNSDVRFNER